MTGWREFDELSGRHHGQLIFVMGTSGSLMGVDLQGLRGHVVIGTNDTLRFFTPDYLLVVDTNAVERAMSGLMVSPKVTLLTRKRIAERARDMGFKGPLYVFDVSPGPQLRMKGPFQQVDNTAHYAVEAAVRMRGLDTSGAIGLVGVDLRYPTEEEKQDGQRAHMFSDDSHCRPAFSKAIKQFPATARSLRARGVDLVTCSPWDGPLTQVLLRRTPGELIDDVEGG